MISNKSAFTILLLAVLTFYSYAQEKTMGDFTLKVSAEDRFFFRKGLYEGQEKNFLSLAVQPEYSIKWNEEKFLFKVSLFGRYDQHDSRRTHADIRELYWQIASNRHELSIGVKKIFWGVAESNHVVNIINQTDIVESFDGEEKLGQPMVHYSYQSGVGIFDFFFMPYFRQLTFPGEPGRLRTPFVLNKSMIAFESGKEEYRPDVAVRWSRYIGKFDIGISHFYGTGRQPLLKNLEDFNPVYAIVNQTGVDVQATIGPMLWKLEGVINVNDIDDYAALAAGFEYTFGNVNGNGLDIGLLSEYLYDSRDELTFSSLQNDVFVGTRVAFNNAQDSQVLSGVVLDVDHGTALFSIEASQRIKESWKIELEGRFFSNTSNNEFIYFARKDSFLRLAINKFF